MDIQAVIFDLDNTLVNRQAAFKAYSEQFIDRFTVKTHPSERTELIEYMRVADRDGYRNKRELYQELLEKFNMKSGVTVDQLLNYWFEQFFRCTVLMDGAEHTLQRLKAKGIKLGVITNGSIRAQHRKIDQTGLRSYFDDIIVSDEVGCKKPDQAIFKLALERLGVEAQACLFVGDHPVNDIQGASKAGLTPVWLQGFRQWEPSVEAAPHTISRLEECLQLVEQLMEQHRSGAKPS
ncbi:haloacid dehalogenase [Paenibacillus montaniterrae]|uniref:Haloacid dehalogenase n=1 Tax=Paenibacillus montaniterrae TaxID=429341 RepID=A0A919YRG0_9BACL|nr:HAD family hydrolase [Paenibacillus montaniterrae]GIP18055.1 haloacid dehalogenase [Paenibacillus montaniterrae]